MNYGDTPPVGVILSEIGQTECLLFQHKPLVRQMARELIQAGFQIYCLLGSVALYLPGKKIIWFAGDLRPARMSIAESFEELQEVFPSMGAEKAEALCKVYNKTFDRLGYSEHRFNWASESYAEYQR